MRNRWSGAFRLLDLVLIGFSLEEDDSLIFIKDQILRNEIIVHAA